MTRANLRQLGYVTQDLEAAARHWVETMGAGPFFVIEGMALEGWSFHGAPQDMTLDIAMGQAGTMMIELIRPNGPWPNVYGDAPPKTLCMAHHHGYLVPDLDTAQQRIGAAPVTQARLSPLTELRYYDCRATLGLHVELITDSEEARAFFDFAASAAADWDGVTDPIRPFAPEAA